MAFCRQHAAFFGIRHAPWRSRQQSRSLPPRLSSPILTWLALPTLPVQRPLYNSIPWTLCRTPSMFPWHSWESHPHHCPDQTLRHDTFLCCFSGPSSATCAHQFMPHLLSCIALRTDCWVSLLLDLFRDPPWALQKINSLFWCLVIPDLDIYTNNTTRSKLKVITLLFRINLFQAMARGSALPLRSAQQWFHLLFFPIPVKLFLNIAIALSSFSSNIFPRPNSSSITCWSRWLVLNSRFPLSPRPCAKPWRDNMITSLPCP